MQVPEGWARCKLQDITQEGFRNGFSSTEVQKETGYYVLGLGALTGEGIDLTQIKNVEYSENWESAQIFAGDFLISRSNTPDKVGRVAQYKGGLENCSYPDLMVKFKINSKRAISSYIEYFLQSSTTQYYYQRFSGGSSRSMVKINQSTIGNTPLLIPPLAEQEKIADILSTWDHAIEQTEHLKANAETHKQALMQQLLTGKKRFPEFEGEWKEKALGNIVKISKGKALTSKNIVEGDYPVIAGGQTSPYNHNEYTHENVITVSASGAYAGFVAFHNYKIWASDCSVIEESKKVKILYIYYFLSFQQERIYTYQSGGAQPHIYPRDLAVMKIKLPSLEEQQKIAAVLNTADREIELLAQKLDYLKTEKRALMQQLLTGKRRVKVDG